MSLRIDCCCNLYTGLLSCNEIAGDLTREEKKNYDGKSIPSQAKRFMIKFGLNEGTKSIAVADEGCIDIEDGGKLIFEGNADFKPGCKIDVKSKGVLEIGTNFTCNRNGLFSVDAPVCIGEDALLGWNVKLRTSDGHPIYEIEDESKEINLSYLRNLR